jgi:hypothetical protein
MKAIKFLVLMLAVGLPLAGMDVPSSQVPKGEEEAGEYPGGGEITYRPDVVTSYHGQNPSPEEIALIAPNETKTIKLYNALDYPVYVAWYDYQTKGDVIQRASEVYTINPDASLNVADMRETGYNWLFKVSKTHYEQLTGWVSGLIGWGEEAQGSSAANRSALTLVLSTDLEDYPLGDFNQAAFASIPSLDNNKSSPSGYVKKNFLLSKLRFEEALKGIPPNFIVDTDFNGLITIQSSSPQNEIQVRNSCSESTINFVVHTNDRRNWIQKPINPQHSIWITLPSKTKKIEYQINNQAPIVEPIWGNLVLYSIPGGTYTFELDDPRYYENRFTPTVPLVFNPEVVHGPIIFHEANPGHLEQERAYIDGRKNNKVKKAIQGILPDLKLPDNFEAPTIAFVSTGGGHRAHLYTMGALVESERVGLFDTYSYLMGLSGSTWGIFSLIASGKQPKEHFREMVAKQRLDAHEKAIINIPGKNWASMITSPGGDYDELYRQLRYSKLKYHEHNKLVGKFGSLLGYGLLPDAFGNKLAFGMSRLRATMQDYQYPLPIGVSLDSVHRFGRPRWYETSPFYFGTRHNGGHWLKTEFVGTVFKDQQIFDQKPEQPLSYWLGIFGSAFAMDDESLRAKIGGKAAVVAQPALKLFLGDAQSLAGRIPNFVYGIHGEPDYLHLIDGGHRVLQGIYRHNFASVPVLYRDVDIIIMLDCNESGGSNHLLASTLEAELYANEKLGRRLLDDNEYDAGKVDANSKKGLPTVFRAQFNKDHSRPIVIYINVKRPEVFPKGLTNTEKFNHTADDMMTLAGYAHTAFAGAVDAIKDAIRDVVTAKNPPQASPKSPRQASPEVRSLVKQQLQVGMQPVSVPAQAPQPAPEVPVAQPQAAAPVQVVAPPVAAQNEQAAQGEQPPPPEEPGFFTRIARWINTTIIQPVYNWVIEPIIVRPVRWIFGWR